MPRRNKDIQGYRRSHKRIPTSMALTDDQAELQAQQAAIGRMTPEAPAGKGHRSLKSFQGRMGQRVGPSGPGERMGGMQQQRQEQVGRRRQTKNLRDPNRDLSGYGEAEQQSRGRRGAFIAGEEDPGGEKDPTEALAAARAAAALAAAGTADYSGERRQSGLRGAENELGALAADYAPGDEAFSGEVFNEETETQEVPDESAEIAR